MHTRFLAWSANNLLQEMMLRNWFLGLIPVSHLPLHSVQTTKYTAAIAARHYRICPAIIAAALTLTSSPLCLGRLAGPSHEPVPIREATSRLTRHIHKLDQKDQDAGSKPTTVPKQTHIVHSDNKEKRLGIAQNGGTELKIIDHPVYASMPTPLRYST